MFGIKILSYKKKLTLKQELNRVATELLIARQSDRQALDTLGKELATAKQKIVENSSALTQQLEKKFLDVNKSVEQKLSEINKSVEQKATETAKGIEQKLSEINSNVEKKSVEINKVVDQRTTETTKGIEQKLSDFNLRLEQSTSDFNKRLEQSTSDLNKRLEQSEITTTTVIKNLGSEIFTIKTELEKQNIPLKQEQNRTTGDKMPSLVSIKNMEEYTGDNIDDCAYAIAYKNQKKFVSHKWEHYLPIYNKLLTPYVKNKKGITLLEIGVQNGGSLETWKDFLPKGSDIYGMDIDEKCTKIPFSDGVTFCLGSASDEKMIEKYFSDKNFDVIVDDGSHVSSDVIKSFELLWDKLNFGGIYIVEDCHTSYWSAFKGGFRYQNSYIEYFKRLVDAINYRYIMPKEHQNIPEEIKVLEKLNKEIASIYFYDSVIVIEKYLTKRMDGFRDYATKREGLVKDFNIVNDVIYCDENTKFEKIFKD